MPIQNVGLSPSALVPTRSPETGAAERRQVPAQASHAGEVKAAEPRQAPGAQSAGVPAEPPAGTDPALWSVLTTEERAFFAKFQAAGPLTYGPKTPSAAQKAIPRGGRLDVTA